MRLSLCVQCNEPFDDEEIVYAYGTGRVKLQEPTIGFSLHAIDCFEHIVCPKDRKPSGD